MGVNKVEFGGETLMDLTEDTVTPDALAEGVTAHDASGEKITGTLNLDAYQTKEDDSLKTVNKTIVGAINELNEKSGTGGGSGGTATTTYTRVFNNTIWFNQTHSFTYTMKFKCGEKTYIGFKVEQFGPASWNSWSLYGIPEEDNADQVLFYCVDNSGGSSGLTSGWQDQSYRTIEVLEPITDANAQYWLDENSKDQIVVEVLDEVLQGVIPRIEVIWNGPYAMLSDVIDALLNANLIGHFVWVELRGYSSGSCLMRVSNYGPPSCRIERFHPDTLCYKDNTVNYTTTTIASFMQEGNLDLATANKSVIGAINELNVKLGGDDGSMEGTWVLNDTPDFSGIEYNVPYYIDFTTADGNTYDYIEFKTVMYGSTGNFILYHNPTDNSTSTVYASVPAAWLTGGWDSEDDKILDVHGEPYDTTVKDWIRLNGKKNTNDNLPFLTMEVENITPMSDIIATFEEKNLLGRWCVVSFTGYNTDTWMMKVSKYSEATQQIEATNLKTLGVYSGTGGTWDTARFDDWLGGGNNAQLQFDRRLNTTDQTVVGAINELEAESIDKVTQLALFGEGVTDVSVNATGIGFIGDSFVSFNGDERPIPATSIYLPIVAGNGIEFSENDDTNTISIDTVVDSDLSSVSKNPVQNRVVTDALNELYDVIRGTITDLTNTTWALNEGWIVSLDGVYEFQVNGTYYTPAISQTIVARPFVGIRFLSHLNEVGFRDPHNGYWDGFTNSSKVDITVLGGEDAANPNLIKLLAQTNDVVKEHLNTESQTVVGAINELNSNLVVPSDMPQIRFAGMPCSGYYGMVNWIDIDGREEVTEEDIKFTIEHVGGGQLQPGDTVQICRMKSYGKSLDKKTGKTHPAKKKLRCDFEYELTQDDCDKRFITITVPSSDGWTEPFNLFCRTSSNSIAPSPLYFRIRRPVGQPNPANGTTSNAKFSNVVTVWKNCTSLLWCDEDGEEYDYLKLILI